MPKILVAADPITFNLPGCECEYSIDPTEVVLQLERFILETSRQMLTSPQGDTPSSIAAVVNIDQTLIQNLANEKMRHWLQSKVEEQFHDCVDDPNKECNCGDNPEVPHVPQSLAYSVIQTAKEEQAILKKKLGESLGSLTGMGSTPEPSANSNSNSMTITS